MQRLGERASLREGYGEETLFKGSQKLTARGWPAARESRAAELSPALTWLQGRHRWPRLFVCRLHFFPLSRFQILVSKEKRKQTYWAKGFP